MSLILHFVISQCAIQLRFVFEKDTKIWSQVKENVSQIMQFHESELCFKSLNTGQTIDELDDLTVSFVNNLIRISIEVSCPRYRRLVQNILLKRNGVSVLVKNTSGAVLRFSVDLQNDTCIDIKHMIDAFQGILSSQQCLVFGGVKMEDYRLLSSYGIQENSEILIIHRILDGISHEISVQDGCFSHLPSIIIYDCVKENIVLTSKPYLFRTEISSA